MALYINLDGFQSGVKRLDFSENAASFEFPADDARVAEPVRLALQVVRDGSMVIISGKAEAEVEFDCGRCLAPITAPVEAELQEIYHFVDGPPPYRPDEDEGIHFVNRRAPRVDLGPAIREQILLELPIKPLCRPDCRGLCPECGANLNEGPCGCASRSSDPRWEALGSLRGQVGETTERPPARNPEPDGQSRQSSSREESS